MDDLTTLVSRAKERVFSFRDKLHRWDPKNQRPELWSLYNGRANPGESIRVFPISNWTELDVWQYIHLEKIDIAPLYYSDVRPVVVRDGVNIMVDDDRFEFEDGEEVVEKSIPPLQRQLFRRRVHLAETICSRCLCHAGGRSSSTGIEEIVSMLGGEGAFSPLLGRWVQIHRQTSPASLVAECIRRNYLFAMLVSLG